MIKKFVCPSCGQASAIKWGRMNRTPIQRYRCQNKKCKITFRYLAILVDKNADNAGLIKGVKFQVEQERDTITEAIIKIESNLKKKKKELKIRENNLENLERRLQITIENEKIKNEASEKQKSDFEKYKESPTDLIVKVDSKLLRIIKPSDNIDEWEISEIKSK
jgi:hypothetical protein